MSVYLRPPDNSRGRSVAVTAYASGLLIANWPEKVAWYGNASGLVSAIVSGSSGFGYCDAVTDNVSGAWLFPYNGGPVVNIASGGAQTTYAAPNNPIFTGAAYSPTQNRVYANNASGVIYTPTGTGLAQISPGFNFTAPWQLSASGATLFAINSPASAISTFTLTASAAGTSGSIGSPVSFPCALTAASGRVGVGGWNNALIASGVAAIDVNPSNKNIALGVNTTANAITLYQNVGGENWNLIQTISGYGAPRRVAWMPNGLMAWVTDAASGLATQINFSAGTISTGQSVPFPSAYFVSAFPGNNSNALLAQNAGVGSASATTLFLSGATWVSGATSVLQSIASVHGYDSSHGAIGYASGVAFVSVSGNALTVSSSATLPYQPQAITDDTNGNIVPAGSNAVSGFFSTFVGTASGQTLSWAGSGASVIYASGQIAVADPPNHLVRVFGTDGTVYSQASTITVSASGTDNMRMATETVFSASPTASGTLLLQFLIPNTLDYLRTSSLSVYVSGSFHTLALGVSHQPAALAFDVSGNLWGATIQNDLYSVSATGGLISSGAIAQASPQPQTTPIGVSSMLWWNGHLYASSSLEGSLIQVI